MKAVPEAFQAHLDGGVTTLAYCWRLTRRDGAVLGFTEHDRDVAALGVTFLAGTGFTASSIEQGLGLSVDNLEASGALSSLGIVDADILAGRYDDAAVDLFWINWNDPSQLLQIASGRLGEVKREGLAFSAELRSLATLLNQKIGLTYGRTCSAVLGDARCRVDLTNAAYRGGVTATSAGLSRDIVVAGLSGFAADWFTDGTLSFGSGANAGLPFEIKSHRRTAGVDILELWLPPPFPVAAGDTGTATAGCRKTLAVCKGKFANVPNFRGFPHIPGTDVVTRYASQGALGQSGGSLFGGA